MSMSPNVRDQTYQFFIEEVPELLQVLETGLLTLRSERSTTKLHELMRAAHSLKGGAAIVGLEGIITIAHRLEDIFRALYDETVVIDADLEGLLLQAYDCLRLPLTEQITIGYFDLESALTAADPIFTQIEKQLGDALTQANYYMPDSGDLNVDIVASVFKVDVAHGLEHLTTTIAANPQNSEIARELRAQAELFARFAEFLELPGFKAIAETTLAALLAHPDQALHIAQLALANFQASREAVLAGDRTQGGSPTAALMTLAETTVIEEAPVSIFDPAIASLDSEIIEEAPVSIFDPAIASLDSEIIEEAPVSIFDPAIASLDSEIIEEAPVSIFDSAIASLNSQAAVEHSQEDLPLSLEDLLSGKKPITATQASENSPVFLFEADIEEVTPTVIDDPEAAEEPPSLMEIVGRSIATPAITSPTRSCEQSNLPPFQDTPTTLPELNLASPTPSISIVVSQVTEPFSIQPVATQEFQIRKQAQEQFSPNAANISVRVDLARLERMNNLLGELTINRNMFALENEQIQEAIEELLSRFDRFQELIKQVQNVSDTMVVASLSVDQRKKVALGNGNRELGLHSFDSAHHPSASSLQLSASGFSLAEFDSLEMDRYGALHSSLQGVLEEVAQLKEAVDDIALFSGRSNRTIRQERQMLSQLRDELMWSRMLPIGNVLSRFPRVLRDMSTTYHKPVSLKLTGTEVQVEKAIVEKLYDPLLHLLRNAFDHGIEPPDIRRQRGKPEQGEIEIRAYHQGNQTVVEVRDDGQGLNLERICSRALERGLLSPEQLAVTPTTGLFELIFEPGFSTASRVSELSGRGVGLDVVRAELQSLKGTITVTSSPEQGTTFTLRLPFTLTVAKLLVCSVGSSTVALPIDSIARIITPQADQTHQADSQQFLTWQEQSIPIYRLVDLLGYNCPLPESFSNPAVSVSSTENSTQPLLLIRREQEMFVLEVDNLVAEQELVIKPFGSMITPPNYISGCTILGSGTLIPVINGALLLEEFLAQSKTTISAIAPATESLATDKQFSAHENVAPNKTHTTPTVLVVDDSATARRALVFTLEKAGYRVLQARDGWEAIEQLRHSSMVQLMICDVEMPKMNGFEFLDYRRQDPQLAKIPVAMLTTRSNSKHRSLAMHLGASAYFTKPYIELEFLSALRNIVGQDAPQNTGYL